MKEPLDSYLYRLVTLGFTLSMLGLGLTINLLESGVRWLVGSRGQS